MTSAPNIVAVNVGNSRTQVGRFTDGNLDDLVTFPNDQRTDIVQRILDDWQQINALERPAVILASVNEQIAAEIKSATEDQLRTNVYVIGDDLPAPIGRQLDPETITGPDRLLDAAAAYDTLQQACVVVDVGTAITIDFVDGEGTFHGGAIAPGAQMQLHALHAHTAALPELHFRPPDDEAFGRNTAQAMLQGVYHGIRGMVRQLTEQYAEQYGAYPLVIATGGDAQHLFGNDELIDRIVPELTLLGINVAARYALSGDDADAPHRDGG